MTSRVRAGSGPSRRLRKLAVTAWQCRNPSFLAGLIYSSIIRHRFRQCGPGLRLKVSTVITGHKNISIGKDFVSMGALYLYADDDGYLQIGDNCGLNTNIQLGAAKGRLVIGNDVMIASNVVIRAANHGMSRRSSMQSQESIPGEIIIEDDVWIGSNAVITSNVKLAKGTVVGAGAVVTKSTEPFSIVAGVPARKIGERL
jgi:acetyltransferase-like isoleucine patch superfamily enzyme